MQVRDTILQDTTRLVTDNSHNSIGWIALVIVLAVMVYIAVKMSRRHSTQYPGRTSVGSDTPTGRDREI